VLKDRQEYDIDVTLSVPRSPPNIERGNFMVSLYLLDSDNLPPVLTKPRLHSDPVHHFPSKSVLFSSRRPALIPYRDPLVSVASRLFFIFYHIMFPSTQTCTLVVPMVERVAFPSISALPAKVFIEVEAGQTIQVYSLSVTLTAQLRGLRWLMYHYRLITFVAFTTTFWMCELLFMGLAWVLFGMFTQSKNPQGRGAVVKKELKDEPGLGNDLSDAPRVFPTYGRQPPLRYEPVARDDLAHGLPVEPQPAGAEADDEEDDYEEKPSRLEVDSGMGTSFSEGGGGQVRRRTSSSR